MSTSIETLPAKDRKHACTGCTAPKAEFKLGIDVFGGGHTNTTFFCAPCLNALVQQGFRALAETLASSLQTWADMPEEQRIAKLIEIDKRRKRT